MREKLLSSIEGQYTDTRGYKLFDLENLEFSWERPALDINSVYQPGIDTPFSPSIFDDFQMEGSNAANPIIVDDGEDKEISAPTRTTPESERPTEPPRLLKSCPFGNQKMYLTPYTGLCFVKFCMCLFLIHFMCFVYTSN